jgi:hypothetical protein
MALTSNQKERRKRSAETAAIHASSLSIHNRKMASVPGLDIVAIVTKFAPADAVVVNDPATWPGIRSKDDGKRVLSLAKHVYGMYRAPAHLDAIWFEIVRRHLVLPQRGDGIGMPELTRRIHFWFCVTQGKSLFRTYLKDMLTKKEVHTFLTPPVPLHLTEAFWFAIASSYTDDHGLRLRVARSKMAQHTCMQGSPRQPFWRDVARFFCVNNVPIKDMNDLYDYFLECQRTVRRDGVTEYSMKGRTLVSVTNAMTQWHRDLARERRVGGGSWDGVKIDDHVFVEDEHAPPHKKITWKITQIKTGKALAEEGNKMHHCVYLYKAHCMSGRTAIWSVTRDQGGSSERALTLETNRDGDIVQIRGYANRSARDHEMQVVRRWARANNIKIIRE